MPRKDDETRRGELGRRAYLSEKSEKQKWTQKPKLKRDITNAQRAAKRKGQR